VKPRLKKFHKSSVEAGKLIMAVRAQAEAHPDRIYTGLSNGECQYKPHRQPDGTVTGCIIGNALRSIGVSTTGCEGRGISTLLERYEIGNLRQLAWLRKVQMEQDLHHQWADAVTTADRLCPLA
jgi:hypothetical protein